MRKIKEKIVQEIIRLGKEKRGLRIPALVFIALFLVIYHAIRDFFLQFRYHPVRQRVLVGILVMALLAGQIGALMVFAEADTEVAESVKPEDDENGEAENTGNRIIIAFAELPDDVRGGVIVPVGTAIDELMLPDTLEAVCLVTDKETEETPENETEDEENIEEEIPESQEEPTEDETSEGDTEQPEDEVVEGEEEQIGDTNTDITDEEVSVEDDYQEAEETDSAAEHEAEAEPEAEMQVETFTVTMPEYQAENVIEIEVLEYSAQPEQEAVQPEEETTTIENIIWQSEPEYDGDTPGEYIFTAVLPEGYEPAEGITMPQITVEVQEDEEVLRVQALIDALPTVEEVKAMDMDGQRAAYDQTQEAYDAYMALSEKQRALITGAEVFEELFAFFNGQIMLLAEGNTNAGGLDITPETGWSYSSNALTINNNGDYTITSYGLETRTQINFPQNFRGTVTLKDVNVHAVYAAMNIKAGANVTLILEGDNYLLSGNQFNAGIEINESTSYLTIASDSNGSLTAQGGSNKAAGIGGGNGSSGGNITITGGNITAIGGGGGAGIGGGGKSYSGNITITGGTVSATGGIGGGTAGGTGTFSTGENGNAVIRGKITDKSGQANWSGVIFEDNMGTVFGDVTIDGDLTIEEDETLTVPEGASLTITENGTVTNKGTIINKGIITNNGKIYNEGTIEGEITGGSGSVIPTASYYNLNTGQTETVYPVTRITQGITDWTGGWYVVNSDIIISERVSVSGEVGLILENDCNLQTTKGITVNQGCSLTIWGQNKDYALDGFLTATGDSRQAGIGGDGSITINGGNVTAAGGEHAAGIGGGTTINGGIVTAKAGDGDTPAIGAAPEFDSYVHMTYGNEETNTETDASVEYTGNPQNDWSSWHWVKIQPMTVNSLSVSAESDMVSPGEKVKFNTTLDVTVNGRNVPLDVTALAEWHVDGSEAGSKIEAGILTVSANESAQKLTVTVSFNGKSATSNVSIMQVGVPYYDPTEGTMKTAPSALPVTGDTTEWKEGWYVVIGEVTVSNSINVTGSVNLILTDGCNLQATRGITVNEGNSLTIWGQNADYTQDGTLTAVSTSMYAGIGNGYSYSSSGSDSCITINGGKINATGGFSSAGIGGSHMMSMGSTFTITINGGTVNAIGGNDAAGIGGGEMGMGAGSSITITITGGTINAIGGSYGAGIGGGYRAAGSNIIITGGTINATGGNNGGAGIGGGYMGEGSNIVITGGTVTAIGGSSYYGDGGGQGIGSGYSGSISGGNTSSGIIISGGTVTAQAGDANTDAIGAAPGFDGYVHMTYGNEEANTETEDYVEWTGNEIDDWSVWHWVKIQPMTVSFDITPKEDTVTLNGTNSETVEFTAPFIGAIDDGNELNLSDKTDDVDWNVIGGGAGTVIGGDGILTVAADERATSLTVTVSGVWNSEEYTSKAIVTIKQPTYTITFDSQDGSGTEEQIVPRYGTAKKPDVPTRSGYTLVGWYTDKDCSEGNEYIFTDEVTGDMTLYAKWSEIMADGVTLDKTMLSLNVGDSETLTATVDPADTLDSKVSWTSSNTSIVTVDENGKVTALSAGTATVTVTTANGKTAVCTVTVVNGSGEDSDLGSGSSSSGSGGIGSGSGGNSSGGSSSGSGNSGSGIGNGSTNSGNGNTAVTTLGSEASRGADDNNQNTGSGNRKTGNNSGRKGTEDKGDETTSGDGDIPVGETGTTVTIPEGSTAETNEDGSVTVPESSVIHLGNDGPDITVGEAGARINADGSITVPGGGSVRIGDVVITLSVRGGTIIPNADGTVTVPTGSVVTRDGQEPLAITGDGAIYDPQTSIVTSIEDTEEARDDSSDISEDAKHPVDSTQSTEDAEQPEGSTQSLEDSNDSGSSMPVIITLVSTAGVAAGGGCVFLFRKKIKRGK